MLPATPTARQPAITALRGKLGLEGGAVPDRPIGGGETLRDIQWVNLAEDWDEGLRRILTVLRPESPKPRPKPSPQEPRTLVVMMTDIVGSASAARRLGDKSFNEFMRDVMQTLAGAVAKHSGESVAFTGDGMIATFGTAPQAIACALAIQRDMSASKDLRSLKIRLGLHAGPVESEDGAMFGKTFELTARICSLAEGNEILISQPLHRLATPGTFHFRERGLVALKGFATRVRIFEVRR